MQQGGDTDLGMLLDEMIPGITHVFRYIEIAEEEIRRAIEGAPESATALNGCFLQLQPPTQLKGRPEALYRAYCRELLERVVDGTALELPTKPEVLLALSQLSLKAPLNRNALALYESLFAEIFGSLPDGAIAVEPDWTGADQELFVDISRQLGLIRRSGISP